jgi:hypothetical protein
MANKYSDKYWRGNGHTYVIDEEGFVIREATEREAEEAEDDAWEELWEDFGEDLDD